MGRKILDLDFKCSKCWTPVYFYCIEKLIHKQAWIVDNWKIIFSHGYPQEVDNFMHKWKSDAPQSKKSLKMTAFGFFSLIRFLTSFWL